MNKVQQMRRYIELTGAKYGRNSPYDIGCDELNALAQLNRFEAICLAFRFGRAKGERHARAEAKARRKKEVSHNE